MTVMVTAMQELSATFMVGFWQREEERYKRLIPIRRRQLQRLSLVIAAYRERPRKLQPGVKYNRKYDRLMYCSRSTNRYVSVKLNLATLDLIEEAIAGCSTSLAQLRQEIDMGRVHPLWLRYYRLAMDLSL